MGAAFTGNFAHTIDPKGRATIPACYRMALGDRFTIGLNSQMNALALYPLEKWNQIEADLNRIASTDAKGMRYVRFINGFSFTDCQLDSQGRVLLPAILRQKVGIMDKAIRFVGVGQCLEIWAEDRFVQETEQTELSSEELLAYINEKYFQPRD